MTNDEHTCDAHLSRIAVKNACQALPPRPLPTIRPACNTLHHRPRVQTPCAYALVYVFSYGNVDRVITFAFLSRRALQQCRWPPCCLWARCGRSYANQRAGTQQCNLRASPGSPEDARIPVRSKTRRLLKAVLGPASHRITFLGYGIFAHRTSVHDCNPIFVCSLRFTYIHGCIYQHRVRGGN